MGEPLEDQPLGYLLFRVASALRTEVTATTLEPLGLSFAQYLCLRVLSKFPGRSNAELARDLSVSPQAMNTVVRALQQRGMVSRPASVPAGRSLPTELTQRGAELLARTDEGVRAAEDHLMADLTTEQRRAFKKLLVALGSDA